MQDFALIVLDRMMPGQDGVEVAERFGHGAARASSLC